MNEALSVAHIVAPEFDITVSRLMSRDRSADVALPRQIAMYICYKVTRLSTPEVGRQFKRDHGTVLHAKNRVQGLCDTELDFNAQVANLMVQANQALSPKLEDSANAVLLPTQQATFNRVRAELGEHFDDYHLIVISKEGDVMNPICATSLSLEQQEGLAAFTLNAIAAKR